MLLATATGGQVVIDSLQLMSKASEAFDGLWKLFLMGELYRVISLSVLPLLLPFIVKWIFNSIFNSRHALDDMQRFTGDLWSYAMIGLIIIGIVSSSRTGAMLYSFHRSANLTNQEYVDVAVRLAKDPGTALATIVTIDVANSVGMAQCDRIADPVQKEKCIQGLVHQGQGLAQAAGEDYSDVVTSNVTAPPMSSGLMTTPGDLGPSDPSLGIKNPGQVDKDQTVSSLSDTFVLIVIVPVLMIVGTAFLMGLDLGALMFVLMTPWTLLI